MIKYKITIVDDEKLFKAGIKVLLEQDEKFQVVHEAGNGQELLNLVEQTGFESDVILMDLSMPVMDGIDTLLALNKAGYQYKIIILSSHYNDSLILKLLDEGVSGFLAKNENPEDFLLTIKKVAENGFYINDHILNLIRNRRLLAKKKGRTETLTNRELEIIDLMCQEMTTKEIAQKLYISPRTVEGHRNRILDKIGCRNVAGVVVYAIEQNLFEVKISRYQ